MGEAALSGSLSAVGLLELLRLPMTTGRTGMLIVVNSDPEVADAEARLHYREGTLVAGAVGNSSGEAALRRILGWKDGYFEFLGDTPMPERVDAHLHSVALTEIKNWYAARTSSRPAAAVASGSSPALQIPRATPKPEIRPTPLRAVPAPKGRPSAASGSALVDARGNLADVVGQVSPKDGALAFAALQLATAIGKEMVMGAPQSVEVRAKKDHWLGAAVRGDTAFVVICPPESDLTDELSRK